MIVVRRRELEVVSHGLYSFQAHFSRVTILFHMHETPFISDGIISEFSVYQLFCWAFSSTRLIRVLSQRESWIVWCLRHCFCIVLRSLLTWHWNFLNFCRNFLIILWMTKSWVCNLHVYASALSIILCMIRIRKTVIIFCS